MKLKQYSKPILIFEQFVPNEYVAMCNATIHFTSTAFYEYTQNGSTTLYHDGEGSHPKDGRYQNGERVGASSAYGSSNMTVDLQASLKAGYLTFNSNNKLIGVNQSDGSYYYGHASSSYNSPANYVYKIIDSNGILRYVNSLSFNIVDNLHS